MPDHHHSSSTATELRGQAARARRLAEHLFGDEAEERLQKLADELEAKAAAMDGRQLASNKSVSPDPLPRSSVTGFLR
jgi:hypothetical protein